MSDLNQAVEAMIGIIEMQEPLMRNLLQGMREERSAFVAARPSILERIKDRLGPIAEQLSELENQRRPIELEIKQLAQLDGDVTVSCLLPQLPSNLAARLSSAANACSELAKSLQVEQVLGNQLLAFSHQAQESMYRDLMGAEESNHAAYDKDAKTLTSSPQSGQLISGLI